MRHVYEFGVLGEKLMDSQALADHLWHRKLLRSTSFESGDIFIDLLHRSVDNVELASCLLPMSSSSEPTRSLTHVSGSSCKPSRKSSPVTGRSSRACLIEGKF